MSYYYNYYIGYKKDNKIYPLGPYDALGNLRCTFYKSQSFASDLYEDFYEIADEQVSDELKKEFEHDLAEDRYCVKLSILPYTDLPEGSYIKSGYFLITDVEAYLQNHDSCDLFYEYLSPEIYAAKSANEIKFGPPKKKINQFGEPYYEHSAADYMWFTYADYNCKEYEVFKLKQMCSILEDYTNFQKENMVILLTQG